MSKSTVAGTPAFTQGQAQMFWGAMSRPASIRFLIVVSLLAFWEVSARLWGNSMFTAPVSSTLGSMGSLLQQSDVINALGRLLLACLAAFALSVTLGTLLGLVIGSTTFLRAAFFPIILMLYATPQSPFLPLITITFGTGIEAKIVYGFTHGVFPMAVTIVSGLQNVDRRLMLAAHSMGASRWQVLIRVTFPYILQSLFTGMRMTMAVVLLGVLLSELYISAGGIGYFTRMYSNRFEPSNLFALITILALIAITLNETCRGVERAYNAWRSSD
jgi:ABC-type nitrate/sulfonate/bicarbonate transport system permease component